MNIIQYLILCFAIGLLWGLAKNFTLRKLHVELTFKQKAWIDVPAYVAGILIGYLARFLK